MLIAPLVTIPRNGISVEVHQRKRKKWHIYATEFYSAVMKNEIMMFEEECVELEVITLRKINQTQTSTAFSVMYKTYI